MVTGRLVGRQVSRFHACGLVLGIPLMIGLHCAGLSLVICGLINHPVLEA